VVLPVTFGTRENYLTEFIKFEVANFESSYHAILGRPALAKFMAVPHYVYLLLKMPGRSGVLTLRGDLKKSYDCNQEAIQYASTTRVPDASGEVLAAALSQARLEIPTRKASKSSIQSTGDVALKTIQLQVGDSSKTAVIGGAGLDEKYKFALVSFLRANRDIFAWKPADMPGAPKELIEHSLNVNAQAVPKKQRLRRFAHDKREAIKQEIAKLLAAGFIKEVIHPEWVANPILVR
jgi:hypothetical protein